VSVRTASWSVACQLLATVVLALCLAIPPGSMAILAIAIVAAAAVGFVSVRLAGTPSARVGKGYSRRQWRSLLFGFTGSVVLTLFIGMAVTSETFGGAPAGTPEGRLRCIAAFGAASLTWLPVLAQSTRPRTGPIFAIVWVCLIVVALQIARPEIAIAALWCVGSVVVAAARPLRPTQDPEQPDAPEQILLRVAEITAVWFLIAMVILLVWLLIRPR